MTQEQTLTKKYDHPELWEALESISEVLQIETLKIFEKKRNLLHVKARYFLINFSLIYTEHNLEFIANYLKPAITNHSSVSCGRDKIQFDIENYTDIRNQWIQFLQNYKSKLQSNENNNQSDIINRIDKYLNRVCVQSETNNVAVSNKPQVYDCGFRG